MSSSFDLKTLQNRILESLESDKEREVLFSRFGLNGRKIETLENIGNRFGVTRERIRQIEKTILKKIRNYKFLIKDFSGLYNVVTKKGGLISESRLQDAISANGENNKIILNIMLVSSANVFVINNKYFNSVWRVDTCDEDELINIAKLIVSYFKEYKKVASLK